MQSYAPISPKGHDDDDDYSFMVTPCGTDFLCTASGFGKPFFSHECHCTEASQMLQLPACKKRLVLEYNDTIGV